MLGSQFKETLLDHERLSMGEESYYQHTLGSRIAVLFRYDSEFIRQRLREFDLGTHDMAVLMQLRCWGEASHDKIVEGTHMNKTTLSKTVAKLANRGLVYTSKHPCDKRVVNVGLTEAGRAIIPSVQAVTEEWISILTKGFDDDENRILIEYVDRLLQNARSYNESIR